ncbi:MAG: 16S rRNA (cytosine(1402)-N(4))-methyltransferase [Candidatus Schekmanbacteria bacterium RBG_16_38_11]|uniref:Ribosomal RNA small subunit methyltransferase H n=1 Tax=Candidatus Schekmanbacteria bacterium RBG_16_38_11 TaxID=1817880 RepID=A0A1F7RXA9_9BACT|nr:MAG: 16S rRNA (cytosine(1402)-N(4))-methyltransferase [Candidatus Schekmanbacteria bacterium RBG_16_38_11]
MGPFHIPVLAKEVTEFLKCAGEGIFVDCTLGGGGHSEAILKVTGPKSLVIGIDQDEEAIRFAFGRLGNYGKQFRAIKGNFKELESILEKEKIKEVDGILFDLGVSSHQFEEPSRGFSLKKSGPLDMRMDLSRKITAYDLINNLSEEELKNVIRSLGEEKWAGKIARAIVKSRNVKKISTTTELAEIISNIIPKSHWPVKIHPATRTFQALRIKINDEIQVLLPSLTAAHSRLKVGGRLCVISYHSLEDRIVKEFFTQKSRSCICPPKLPECRCHMKPTLKIINRKPVIASASEISENPRARSAKLRAGERI